MAGAGFEAGAYYRSVKIKFANIENIHVMRASLQRLREVVIHYHTTTLPVSASVSLSVSVFISISIFTQITTTICSCIIISKI